jgi:predicted permease
LGSFVTRRQDDERRLNEEIEEHIALQTEENLRAGLSPVEARRQAMLKLGGVEAIKQDCRAERGLPLIENLLQDLRFAFRILRKSPSFTAVAVLTLALAIGANAVVFGALNGLILRPLNVPQVQSLYTIERASDKLASESYPNYLDLRDRNRSFDGLAAFNVDPAGFDTGGNPSRVWVLDVSGNYFDVLGIQPYVGRLIHSSDEDGPNSAPYVVLTYAYWHSHFQDDRGVVGRTVQVNKHPFTIIGVTPPGFHGTLLFLYPDFFVSIVDQEQIEGWNNLEARGNRWAGPVGHLKAGVTPAQAIADLNSIGSDLEKNYPKDNAKMTFALARPSLFGDFFGGPVKAFLAGLMLLAGLILLAACANLGSLFAARAADRSREVALRLALGASRLRILRQLFTEAMLISLIGGAAGLWGSIILLGLLSTWQPVPQYPCFHIPVRPDANVYGVALLLALVSGFLFGAVPVRQVLHTDPYQIVKSGSIGSVGRRMAVRDALLVVQIAICAVLVTSSMVAVRGLLRSLHSNFGFEPRNAMLVDTDLNMAGYRGDKVPTMQKRMIDAMSTIAGVTSVGLVDAPPLVTGGINDSNVFTDETTDLRPLHAAADAAMFNISPDYFHAAGTALLAGRTFTWHDDKNAPRVAVVNREFASKIFGSATNAMDKYYKIPDGTRIQVVGIVEDGKYGNLTENPQPAMFLPILQSPSSSTWLVVRSNGDPQQLSAAMRSKLRDLDSGLPCFIRTWNRGLDTVLFPSRMATISLGVLGVMGAMLSITGIFGMAAYSVSRRLKELGIRVALGAQRKEVLQAALGRAFKLLTFGSVAGLLLGILASRVLSFIVYSATPRDPLVLAGAVLAMLLLGLVATWIPARRALSVDPMQLLREE